MLMNHPFKLLYGRSGVYRIWFGDRFYIGSSSNIYNRMRLHESDLSRYLGKGRLAPESGSWQANLIGEDTDRVIVGRVEILDICSEEDHFMLEDQYLKAAEGDPRCLNSRFYVTKKCQK